MFSIDVYFFITLLVICLGSKFVDHKKTLSAQFWKSFWFSSGVAQKLTAGEVLVLSCQSNMENSKEAGE